MMLAFALGLLIGGGLAFTGAVVLFIIAAAIWMNSGSH